MALKLFTEVVDFVEKEVSVIDGDAKKAEQELLHIAGIGSNILEAAKNYVTANPVGETLLSVIEAIPEVGPIAADVVNVILPKAVGALSFVESNVTDPEAIVTAGLKAVAANQGADEVATIYTGISSLITNKIAPLLNVTSTIQAALSVTPSCYVKPTK